MSLEPESLNSFTAWAPGPAWHLGDSSPRLGKLLAVSETRFPDPSDRVGIARAAGRIVLLIF